MNKVNNVQFLDTGEDAADTDGNGIMCHRITGKGTDLVGVYSLCGKSFGNQVLMNKTYHHYHGQGNQATTDSGHVMRIRLLRLDNTQILVGTYSVKTVCRCLDQRNVSNLARRSRQGYKHSQYPCHRDSANG